MSTGPSVGRFLGVVPWVIALSACGAPQTAPGGTLRPTAVASPPTSEAPRVSPEPGAAFEPSRETGVAERHTPPIAALLADGFASRFVERAKVWVLSTGRVRVDEPLPKPPEVTENFDVKAVIERRIDAGDHPLLRVAIDTPVLRAALWMDDQSLARVLTRRAVFAASARSTPPSRGPVGYPGLVVRVEEESGSRARVSASYEFPSPDSGVVTLSGWLDKDAIGVVYTPRASSESAVDGEASFVAAGTDLFASVGGPVIARVTHGAGGVFFPVDVVGRHHGKAEVLLVSPELEVRGLVDQRVLQPLEPETPRGWGRAHFEAKLWRRWPKEQVHVESGTCIYDAPGGEVIGIVKRSHTANVVVPQTTPKYRAYRLPHEAVGFLRVADLKVQPSKQTHRESRSLAVEEWSCPEQ